MKILYFYCWRDPNYNHFGNIDYIINLNNLPNTEVKLYGPNTSKHFPDLSLTEFDKKLTIYDIKEMWDFDVVVLAGKNRSYYDSTEVNSWLPEGFDDYNCLKILVEPDMHKYRNDSWFKERNINIILHRHKTSVTRGIEDHPEIKHIWFPYSVDNNIFKPTSGVRLNKICFVGNSKSSSYFFRKEASNKLNEKGLLDFVGTKFEEQYLQVLNQYTIYLNGASNYTIDCAKAFEIIASGGILFTNQCPNGFRELFPDCFIEYKSDFTDIIEQANNILNNPSVQNKLIEKGLKTIKLHTHIKRCQQLVSIIKETFPYISEDPILDIVYPIGNLNTDALIRFKNSLKSLSYNKNYRILISEVGPTSSYEKLKDIISDFEYYYTFNEDFDASISKNNAYKYLIKNELFTFMDIDIIIPNNFVDLVFEYYNKYKKAFICSYVRTNEGHPIDYDSLMKEYIDAKRITESGILVCSRQLYNQLNGFDEEYRGWGGRDSDFYMRAEIMGEFRKCLDIVLYHQYHPRNFGEYKESNKIRYKRRKSICKKYSSEITNFKGLNEPTVQNTAVQVILNLIHNNIDVCLLKKTCYERVKEQEIEYPLYLGVSDIEKAKSIENDSRIKYSSIPESTKTITLGCGEVKVPLPVIPYLKYNYKV